jgi:predicted  nucleic acid-binding Zn-ribbon protein
MQSTSYEQENVKYLRLCISTIINSPHFYKGKQVANYTQKLHQIEQLKTELEAIKNDQLQQVTELLEAKHDEKTLPQIVNYLVKKHDIIFQQSEQADKDVEAITKFLEEAENSQSDIVSTETALTTLLETITTQTTDQETQFNQAFTKLTQANATVEKQKITLQTLQTEIQKLQEQTQAELKNALDINTFKEFNSVANKKDIEKWIWLGCFVMLTALLACLGHNIATTQGWFDAKITATILNQYKQPWQLFTFYGSKLVVVLPIAGVAWFCVQRFLRESRYAEEYRFKSTCALHFNSYIELVQKLCSPNTDDTYRQFLISQINQLFTSPTERIYKNSNTAKGGELKAVSDTLELFVPQLTKIKHLLQNVSEDHPDDKTKS